jgi:hypothetical protein
MAQEMCVLPMAILMIFSSWIEGVASGHIVGGITALPMIVMVDAISIKRGEALFVFLQKGKVCRTVQPTGRAWRTNQKTKYSTVE